MVRAASSPPTSSSDRRPRRARSSNAGSAGSLAARDIRSRGRDGRLAGGPRGRRRMGHRPTLIAAGVGVDWLEQLRRCCRRRTWSSACPIPVEPSNSRPCSTRSPTPPPHLRVARLGQAVHADGPGAAPDVRRPRGPRRHVDDARAQARRRHRDRPRLRPCPPADLRLPGELNQVWTNLIDNAADAMERQARSRCARVWSDDRLMVEIGDTGPGVPDEIPTASSSRSSPPRTSERAPASASTSPGRSSSVATAVRSAWSRTRGYPVPGHTSHAPEILGFSTGKDRRERVEVASTNGRMRRCSEVLHGKSRHERTPVHRRARR